MQEFGPQLAPLVPHAPDVLPAGPNDLPVARVSVRSNGADGFLFFNNFVRDGVMPARKGFQVQVKLAAETVNVPATPIDLPSVAYGIWPMLATQPARCRSQRSRLRRCGNWGEEAEDLAVLKVERAALAGGP